MFDAQTPTWCDSRSGISAILTYYSTVAPAATPDTRLSRGSHLHDAQAPYERQQARNHPTRVQPHHLAHMHNHCHHREHVNMQGKRHLQTPPLRFCSQLQTNSAEITVAMWSGCRNSTTATMSANQRAAAIQHPQAQRVWSIQRYTIQAAFRQLSRSFQVTFRQLNFQAAACSGRAFAMPHSPDAMTIDSSVMTRCAEADQVRTPARSPDPYACAKSNVGWIGIWLGFGLVWLGCFG